MPMGPAYDKLIESRFADIKNSGGRPGRLDHRGAVPRALRRQRAVGASRHRRRGARAARRARPTPSWAPGFGVALLDRFVRDNYEEK